MIPLGVHSILPDGSTVNLISGQHRAAALKVLYEEKVKAVF